MLTVTKLARTCGLSRSTLLYYESAGLLQKPARTAAGYRRYDAKSEARLRQICVYRKAGLRLADIREILDRPQTGASAVLTRRLAELDGEIDRLRDHQRAIFRLLKGKTQIGRQKVINKENWISIMKAAGFSPADMNRWHSEFEALAPNEHQEFLQFLHIPAQEIQGIRKESRKGASR
jgi:MerR family transcriptional regulator, thiopeptide resistance regulator